MSALSGAPPEALLEIAWNVAEKLKALAEKLEPVLTAAARLWQAQFVLGVPREGLNAIAQQAVRHCETSQWDLDALKIEFEQLIVVDAPIEISGFAPAEIDHILLGDEANGVETGPLEPPAGATAISRPGDVFLLGIKRNFLRGCSVPV